MSAAEFYSAKCLQSIFQEFLDDEADFASSVEPLGRYKENPPSLGPFFNLPHASDTTTRTTATIAATALATSLFICNKMSAPPLNEAAPISDGASFYVGQRQRKVETHMLME
jgi:hypothetical protein